MDDARSASATPREPDYRLDRGSPAAKLLDECLADARANTARKDRDRQDWRNLLFYRGGDAQWMVWDRGTHRFVERGYDPERGGLPEYIPRCVTNLFANKIDGIVALLNQSQPAKEYSPASDQAEDLAAAQVAEDAVPVLLDEIGYEDDLRPRANQLIALTDKAFLVPYYDTDAKYGTDIIPDYRCPDCPVQVPAEEGEDDQGQPLPCPQCGQPMEVAIQANGIPLGQTMPIGRLCCELIPSFEASLPSTCRTANADRAPWFLSHTRMRVADIEQRWPEARRLELGTRRGSKRQGGGGLAREYADAMGSLSAPSRAQANQGGDTGSADPVVYRLQHDPIVTDEYYFPAGLMVTMVEDTLVEAGPLPVRDSQGRPRKSVVVWQYADVPNTAFGKPPADDLVPLQEAHNVTESLLQLILQHDAAPRTYVPLSVTLENEITGAPGQVVYYRSTVPGETPTTERGLNPPEGLYRQLELIAQRMDEISKLNSVLQGSRPEGNPTLGEVEILQERGMTAFQPVMHKLAGAERQLISLLLWIARDSAWSPRFRQVVGDNGEWDVKSFVGADLGGKIDIRIDPSSAWPKSPMMQRLMLKEGFAMGLFPPPAQDPELAEKVQKLLNLEALKPSLDLDRKQVGRKLDRWKAATSPAEIAPPNPAKENLGVHFTLLTNFLKTEEFELVEQNNPPVAQAMLQHVSLIGSLLAMQAMAAAGGAPPAPSEGSDTSRDAGDGSALRSAVESGALTPAGAAPTPADPMQALTAQGVLTPPGAGGPSVDDLVAMRALTPVAPQGPEDRPM